MRLMRKVFFVLAVALFSSSLFAADNYFPPKESAGGWRQTHGDGEIRSLAGMDPERLKLIHDEQLQMYQGPWAIVIISKGYLVEEWFGVPAMPNTTYDAWSATKSATGIAMGMLLDDSIHHTLPGDAQISLDTPIYDYIPEGHPFTDPRKKDIKLRHVLSMTSGIAGEDHGLVGIGVDDHTGEYEVALGLAPTRFGKSTATLAADPGTNWEYSDAAFAHLSLFFSQVDRREISDYMKDRVFDPIGIENESWDSQGGRGHIGPHTNPHSGLHLSARDFARLGYLMAHDGRWKNKQLVPHWWIAEATKSSQQLNPSYGYTFWVNTDGKQWPSVPKDAFAFMGFASNRCYVVPSLDLVVVRLGYAPGNWAEGALLPAVVSAVTKAH
ncbi:MAG TPA: serine hydrolase [Candidatus Acidoferrum sp.]|jgi:CubicO group peptidase (beta-lactamase class C family)